MSAHLIYFTTLHFIFFLLDIVQNQLLCHLNITEHIQFVAGNTENKR